MTNIANWKDPPFLVGKSTISMAIFNSYVSLPEGFSEFNGFSLDSTWTKHLPTSERWILNGVQSTRPQGSRKKQTQDIPLTSAVSGLTNWLPLVFLGTLQLLLWKTDGSVVKWWILYCQVVVKLGLSDVFFLAGLRQSWTTICHVRIQCFQDLCDPLLTPKLMNTWCEKVMLRGISGTYILASFLFLDTRLPKSDCSGLP